MAYFRRTIIAMDTGITIHLGGDLPEEEGQRLLDRAFGWFREVEARCSRFDPASELSRLGGQVDVAVAVSPLLYQAVSFAVEVARASGGAFDPTIGAKLVGRGFNRNYRTGETVAAPTAASSATYRDIVLDPAARTILLRRPLVLDLGAVAKGLAVDLAAHELAACPNLLIDAGGDVYVRGNNPDGVPWRVGIRHPRERDALLTVLAVDDGAVCTSGDYERRSPTNDTEHHLINQHTGHAVRAVASVTVVAPTVMVADALATAAFVLGPQRGLAFLRKQGVEGLLVTPGLEEQATPGFGAYQVDLGQE